MAKEKISFEQYLKTSCASSKFSPSTIEKIRFAYEHNVPEIFRVFSSKYEGNDVDVIRDLNELLRKQHQIRYHNVGKDPLKRYYNDPTAVFWLKLLHFLVAHFYAIGKSETHAQNKTMAITLGILSNDETKQAEIDCAVRRVADGLKILKDRDLIQVTQTHNPGHRGSFHTITANWFEIIPLLQSFDEENAITIRDRKTVRFRILSLLYKAFKGISKAMKYLLAKQRTKYLQELVTMDESHFKDSKDFWSWILEYYKRRYRGRYISFENKRTDSLIPNWINPSKFEVKVKSPLQ